MLRDVGLRPTRQRMALGWILFGKGDRHVTADSLGVRGLGCMDVEFKDVRVDAGAMLGNRGEGFKVALWSLDGGRVAIAALTLVIFVLTFSPIPFALVPGL